MKRESVMPERFCQMRLIEDGIRCEQRTSDGLSPQPEPFAFQTQKCPRYPFEYRARLSP